jgi:hypothetical protein
MVSDHLTLLVLSYLSVFLFVFCLLPFLSSVATHDYGTHKHTFTAHTNLSCVWNLPLLFIFIVTGISSDNTNIYLPCHEHIHVQAPTDCTAHPDNPESDQVQCH